MLALKCVAIWKASNAFVLPTNTIAYGRTQTPFNKKWSGKENKMRRRTIKKQIWLNANEERILKEKSRQSGLNESELIRSFIKGQTIKAQPTHEIKQFQRELYGIANNINQIAKAANTYMYVPMKKFEESKIELADFILRFDKKIYSRGRWCYGNYQNKNN